MRIFIFFSIFAMLSSCITQKKCSERFPPQTFVKDSVIVRDTAIYHTDTLIMPGERVEIHDTIPCPDYHKEVKGKNGSVSVNIIKGVLTAHSECDSLIQLIKKERNERTIERFRNQIKFLPPVVSHEPYWYDKAARWWFLITFIFLSGIIFSKIKK